MEGDGDHLGDRHRIDVLELVGHITHACGRDMEPSFVPWQQGDMQDTLADVTKAREHLGYRPGTLVQAGIRKYVEWFRGAHPLRD